MNVLSLQNFQFSLNRKYCLHLFFYLMFFAILFFVLMENAHATSFTDQGMPYEKGLQKFYKSVTGPVAFALSVIGIVASGATLIFGGDMNGFLRSMIYLVLVIAVIVSATSMLKIFQGDGATIAFQQFEAGKMLIVHRA